MAKDTMKAMLYRSPGDYGLTDVPYPKLLNQMMLFLGLP